MSGKTDEHAETEECEKEKESECEADWKIWTDALEEMSEIEDAFEVDSENKLHGKTILDVGTDCVKPLYLALKYEPVRVIGINEDFSIYPFEADLKQKSRLFVDTEIEFYDCSFLDDTKLERTVGEQSFDFVLVSKTLHHLRTGECVAEEHDPKHTCRRGDEKCCIYKFEEKEIFERLFRYGKRVIIYEAFYPHEEDNDKVRGRGGYFTREEWKQTFEHLAGKYKVGFVRPEPFLLDKETLDRIDSILRKVDYICFYAEKQL